MTDENGLQTDKGIFIIQGENPLQLGYWAIQF